MRSLVWAGAVFMVFFLQGRVSVLGVTPDLTAVLAYYAGMRLGETRGLFAGMLFGGLQDVLAQSIVGPNLLGKGAVGFLSASFLSGGILRWTPTLGIVVISLFTLADNAVVFLARSLFDRVPEAFLTAGFAAVMQAILNAPLGIFIRPPHAD
jgi:rod shape-determining protein MreD